jgi:hypothetical protein
MRGEGPVVEAEAEDASVVPFFFFFFRRSASLRIAVECVVAGKDTLQRVLFIHLYLTSIAPHLISLILLTVTYSSACNSSYILFSQRKSFIQFYSLVFVSHMSVEGIGEDQGLLNPISTASNSVSF